MQRETQACGTTRCLGLLFNPSGSYLIPSSLPRNLPVLAAVVQERRWPFTGIGVLSFWDSRVPGGRFPCLVSAAHPHSSPTATTGKSRTSSQHVITHRVAEAFYLARLLLLVVRETSSTVQSALCLCQLKETKIDLASGELGICVGIATCRLAPGEGDRGQEKDPAGASTSLPIFLLALT